jgi:hypothetical protein
VGGGGSTGHPTGTETTSAAEPSSSTTLVETSSGLPGSSTAGPEDSSAGGSASSTGGENGTPPAAGRRWVLVDAEGAPMDAVVEPACDSPENCPMPEIGSVGAISPACVRVVWLGAMYVDLEYSTETGRAEDCSGAPTEHAAGAYADPACTPPSYRSPGGGIQDVLRWTRLPHALTDGQVLYESADSPPAFPAPAYAWGATGCEENPFVGGGNAWIPIPAWAAEALASPPYTLRWE